MLADELYSMIHVPRLKDENAAELFFGFGIGAVGRCHLAVLPIQGQGGLRPLKRFSTGPASGCEKAPECSQLKPLIRGQQSAKLSR